MRILREVETERLPSGETRTGELRMGSKMDVPRNELDMRTIRGCATRRSGQTHPVADGQSVPPGVPVLMRAMAPIEEAS